MFEKDEDYRKARKESKDRITKVIKVWSAREETLHNEGFQKGAEFGYNKANEWHYVKDGKYPKEKQLVMVYRINPLGANIAITNWYDSYKDTKVIAWKEIVLPELKVEK